MRAEDLLKDTLTVKLWNQYFRRMDRFLRRLDSDTRDELLKEIKAHLLESMAEMESGSETEKLFEAIERMGEPEDFLRPMIADKYLAHASRTLSPKAAVRGLYYTIWRGLRWAGISFLFFLGYFLLLLCCVVALFKPIFPKNVGVFMTHSGGPVIGVLGNAADLKVDVLGYWVIPIAFILGAVLYVVLTKQLRFLKQSPQSKR